MVYINPHAIGSGFVLGVMLALTLLVIATLWFEPNKLKCAPDCRRDAIASISNLLQKTKISVFMGYEAICLDSGESIDNSSVKQNAGISLVVFRCSGSVCYNNGTLDVTTSKILAKSNSVFRTTAQCSGVAGSYSCTIDVIDY